MKYIKNTEIDRKFNEKNIKQNEINSSVINQKYNWIDKLGKL